MSDDAQQSFERLTDEMSALLMQRPKRAAARACATCLRPLSPAEGAIATDAGGRCRACVAASGDLDELHGVLMAAAQEHDLAPILAILDQAAAARAGDTGRSRQELFEAYRELIDKYAYVERYAERHLHHAKVAEEMRGALRKALDLL
jgi:hypothetical protein